jgi:hypothetical protein
MLFGFQSDVRSLEQVPAVAQVCSWSLFWPLLLSCCLRRSNG